MEYIAPIIFYQGVSPEIFPPACGVSRGVQEWMGREGKHRRLFLCVSSASTRGRFLSRPFHRFAEGLPGPESGEAVRRDRSHLVRARVARPRFSFCRFHFERAEAANFYPIACYDGFAHRVEKRAYGSICELVAAAGLRAHHFCQLSPLDRHTDLPVSIDARRFVRSVSRYELIDIARYENVTDDFPRLM